MATTRQKKLARAIIENASREKPLTKQELVVSSGYTPVQAKAKMHEITESKGVKDELKALGFTEENAMKVVTEIMLNTKAKHDHRLKATDQVFKVHGTYAPTKSIVANLDVEDESKQKAKTIIRGFIDPA